MRNKDWELLNGLSDDEIGADDRERLLSRMVSEPDLNVAFGEIEALKKRLGALSTRSAPPSGLVRRWAPIGVPALAAAVVVVSVFVIFGFREAAPRGVAGLHAALSEEDFASSASVALGDAVDLSGSNLELVDVRAVEFGFGRADAWHYRGPSGCALTILSGPVLRAEPAPMTHAWRVGETDYLALADGMDDSRFLAVSRFAEAETRKAADSNGLFIAMREETATAKSCV